MRGVGLREDVEDRGRRPGGLAPALEDRGVARLEREGRDLRDGVGPRLEDDEEDAERARTPSRGRARRRGACARGRGRKGRGGPRRRGRRRPWRATFASSRTRRSRREREERNRRDGDFFEGGASVEHVRPVRFEDGVSRRVDPVGDGAEDRCSSSPKEGRRGREPPAGRASRSRRGPSSPSKKILSSVISICGAAEARRGCRRVPLRRADPGSPASGRSRSPRCRPARVAMRAASSFEAIPPRPRAPAPSAYRAISSVTSRHERDEARRAVVRRVAREEAVHVGEDDEDVRLHLAHDERARAGRCRRRGRATRPCRPG